MKSIVLLCSLMLMFIFGFAQTKNALNKSEYEIAIATAKKQHGDTSKTYFQSVIKYVVALNEYKESTDVIRIGTKASIEVESIFGSQNSIYLVFLFNLGKAYQEILETEKADSLFARFILLKAKSQQTYDIDYINAIEYFGNKYFTNDNNKLALKYYEEIQRVLLETKDTTSEQYYLSISMIEHIREIPETEPAENWDSLDKEINRLNMEENHFDAEAISADYLSAAEYEFGITHRNYFLSLVKYDFVLLNTGALKGGTKEYEELLNHLSEYFGVNDSLYSIALTYFGQYYFSVNQYASAKPVYQKLLEIDSHKNDTISEQHFSNLEKLVMASAYLKQFNEAISILKEMAAVYNNRNQTKNDSVYLYYILTLANYEIQLEHYSNALDHYMHLYQIVEKQDNSSGGRYLDILYKVALTYNELGKFDRAELFYRKALEVIKNVYGEEHEYYFNNLNNIAATEMKQGKYKEAELFFRQILEQDKKILRTSPANYSTTLQNLANLYDEMGLYEEAQKLFSEATENVKTILGTKNSEFALCLYYSALTDLRSYQYENSISKLKEAIEIDRIVNKNGTRHLLYYLQALAQANKSINNWKEAESLYNQADSIIIKNYGKVHPLYEGNLVLKGLNAMEMGKFSEAEHLFKDVMKISTEIYGKDHIDYAENMNILGLIYVNLGKVDEALKCFSEYEQVAISFIKNNYGGLSEREKIVWWNSTSYGFYLLPSILYKNEQFTTGYNLKALNTQLQIKGTILAESQKILTSARSNGDKKTNNLYADWQRLRSVLTREYSLPIRERNVGLKNMESMANNIEKEINILSSNNYILQKTPQSGYSEVKNSLALDEVAIEFVTFHLYNKKWTDSTMYAAYILNKKDSVPIFVPLCEEKQLGKYFSSTTGATTVKSIYRSDVVDEDDKPSISGDSLYALIWKPLIPYLLGVKKINYSPAGLLYKVAFHALPAGDSQLLLDKYELSQYTSIRQLAIADERRTTASTIVLFGDCQFSMDSTTIVNNIAASEKANNLITASTKKGEAAGSWKQLPGTADEIKNIHTLFQTNKISSNIFSQVNATEEKFKLLSGQSPKVLHLATHGFFLPDPEIKKQEGFAADERNAFTLADDPLLRSGIVLSGANRVWSGQQPISGREDGIVTAYEIAQMDLSNTNLVVLSACETALGDVKGNEGVFGLQRAFKLAGVKNMLLSLWKVPDAETAEFMKAFYINYLQGKTTKQAYSAAQKEMRKKYKPYYWAAFVMIE